MRSNQAMPLSLTTVTMVMSFGALVGPAPPAGAEGAPPTEPQPASSTAVNPTDAASAAL